MHKGLLFVVIVGALLGFMMPDGKPAEPPVAAATAPGETPIPRETRVQRSANGHFFVHAWVNRQLVRFLVDTGATMVALTPEDAERVGLKVNPDSFEIIGSGASGPVRGQDVQLDSVELDGKRTENVRGAVAEGLEVSLLGQSYLSHFAVEMRGDEMILR